MKTHASLYLIAVLLLCPACQRRPPSVDVEVKPSLLEARRAFATTLTRKERIGKAALLPPLEIFRLVRYPSPAGALSAYVSTKPADGKRHSAIIWLVGGFSNSISNIAWKPGPPKNDQSASAFREAGVLMMYPSLRGGNDNPGFKEGFYGEVDDVLAAAAYLRTVEYIDPDRIYLGGHSTGGTLALLSAECAAQFRAVFAFGPVADVAGYGGDVLPFDLKNRRELELRAPGQWLHEIRTPVFVMEGTAGRSNIGSLRAMARLPHPATVHFLEVQGVDHFGTLAPLTRLIARKILGDADQAKPIELTESELNEAVAKVADRTKD